jgi:hypothetical protein
MVIVVFGDEGRQVNEPLRRAESRVPSQAFKVALVGLAGRRSPPAAYLSRLANQLMTTVIDDREVASAGMVLIRKRPSGATSKGM